MVIFNNIRERFEKPFEAGLIRNVDDFKNTLSAIQNGRELTVLLQGTRESDPLRNPDIASAVDSLTLFDDNTFELKGKVPSNTSFSPLPLDGPLLSPAPAPNNSVHNSSKNSLFSGSGSHESDNKANEYNSDENSSSGEDDSDEERDIGAKNKAIIFADVSNKNSGNKGGYSTNSESGDISDSAKDSDSNSGDTSDSTSNSAVHKTTRPENKQKYLCKGGCQTILVTDNQKYCEKKHRLFETYCHGKCKKKITKALFREAAEVHYCNMVGVLHKNVPQCTFVICGKCKIGQDIAAEEAMNGKNTRRRRSSRAS